MNHVTGLPPSPQEQEFRQILKRFDRGIAHLWQAIYLLARLRLGRPLTTAEKRRLRRAVERGWPA